MQSEDLATSSKRAEVVREVPASTLVSSKPPHNLYFEWLDKTDRQFRFPHGVTESPSKRARDSNPARTRWLELNNVHTQFLDAGIGSCWFAEQGDQEPVCGDTEDEAIARLARSNGLDLWSET